MTEKLVAMLTEEQITRVKELGAQITKDYAGRNLVLVCVLKGSFVFAADLARTIDLPLRVDFLGRAFVRRGTESSGVVQITQDLSRPIEHEDVILVEDIVDTGLTIAHLMDLLRTRPPASVKVCSLLHKPARRSGENRGRLPRLHDRGSLRRRLRARLRGTLPEPAVHRRHRALRDTHRDSALPSPFADEKFFHTLLSKAVAGKASDVHIKVGQPPGARIRGDMIYFRIEKITAEDGEAVARHRHRERRGARAELDELKEYDTSYEARGSAASASTSTGSAARSRS